MKGNQMSDLRFGDVVIVKGGLDRKFRVRTPKNIKEWDRYEFKQPRTGILIGFRTLTNGTITYGSYDEPTEYRPTEHFKAALVALGPRTKPILVRLEDIANEIDMTDDHGDHPDRP